jgi:putative salt-induced outer membrane protein YdiY
MRRDRQLSLARFVATSVCALIVASARLSAQTAAAPAAPTGPLSGSVGAGLAFTSGNTSTSNVNVSGDITYDSKTKNVLKSDALYLRGKTDDQVVVDRLSFNVRDQYSLSPRTFVYGQLQYLRDTFKAIDYLVSPNGGVGVKLVDAPLTTLAVDAGVGPLWEKNPGLPRQTSGAVTSSEHLLRKLSDHASITQQLSGLWKASDFGDAIYAFGATLAAGLTSRSQVHIELLDTYDRKPPTIQTRKNDVATVFSVGYKF